MPRKTAPIAVSNFTTTRVRFDATSEEAELVAKIADRAERLAIEHDDEPFDRVSFVMDLLATNANGTPMDFAKLLRAPQVDFAHDIYGIQRHLNRRTGQLTRCFLPRTAKRTPST